MINQSHIKELLQRADRLKKYLHIDRKEIDIKNLEEKTAAPDFWNDQKEAKKVLSRIKSLKDVTEAYRKLRSAIEDLEVMYDFYKEGEADEEEVDRAYQSALRQLEDLEFKNMMSEEADPKSAVLQITAGAGGTESKRLGRNALSHVSDVGRKERLQNQAAQPLARRSGGHQKRHHRNRRTLCIRLPQRRKRRPSPGAYLAFRQQCAAPYFFRVGVRISAGGRRY